MAESSEQQMDGVIEDEHLHDNLRQYVKGVVRIISSVPDTDGGKPYKRAFVEGEPAETTGDSDISPGRAEILANNLRDSWEEFPGFSECEGAFNSSEIYNKEVGYAINMDVIEGTDKKDELLREDTLPKFLTYYLITCGKLIFKEEVFEKTYSDFENYLSADSIKYRGLALLDGFSMDADSLELEENLRIRNVDKDDAVIEKLDPRPYGVKDDEDRTEYYAMEKEYHVDKFGDHKAERAKETFNNVLLALRLFKNKGDVSYRRTLTESLSPFQTDLNRSAGGGTIRFFGDDYELSSDDCEELMEFWETINGQLDDPPESYRIAIDKFSTSFQRTNQNDRLLDSVIALEALYLKSSEAQEMSYRLSQRGALLLAESKDEALDIKDTLRESYNKRSKLVHGSATDVSHHSIVAIHELTRESLATFLERDTQGEAHEDMLQELDQEAITPAN